MGLGLELVLRVGVRVRARVGVGFILGTRIDSERRVFFGPKPFRKIKVRVRVRLRARVRVLDLTSQTALLRRLSSSKLGRHLRSSATSSRR